MTRRTLAVVLIGAIGGLTLAGCQCRSCQFVGIADNLNGTDWRETMKSCAYECDDAVEHWRDRAAESVSGLRSNLDGSDWRGNIASPCREPVRADPAVATH